MEETNFFNYAFATVWCVFLSKYWSLELSFASLGSAAILFSFLALKNLFDLVWPE